MMRCPQVDTLPHEAAADVVWTLHLAAEQIWGKVASGPNASPSLEMHLLGLDVLLAQARLASIIAISGSSSAQEGRSTTHKEGPALDSARELLAEPPTVQDLLILAEKRIRDLGIPVVIDDWVVAVGLCDLIRQAKTLAI